MVARLSPWRDYGEFEQTTILVPEQLLDRAMILVARRGDGFTFSDLYRQALVDYLEKHNG